MTTCKHRVHGGAKYVISYGPLEFQLDDPP